MSSREKTSKNRSLRDAPVHARTVYAEYTPRLTGAQERTPSPKYFEPISSITLAAIAVAMGTGYFGIKNGAITARHFGFRWLPVFGASLEAAFKIPLITVSIPLLATGVLAVAGAVTLPFAPLVFAGLYIAGVLSYAILATLTHALLGMHC